MSDYDLVPSGEDYGAVRPYQPSPAPLPTTTPATIDAGFYDTPPTGVDQQGFDVFMNDVGNLYASDMEKLGMPANFIVDAYDWYRQHALDTQGESPRHHYSLRGLAIPKAELPLVHKFCNFAASIGMPEQHVKNSIWFVYELAKRLTQQQQPQPQSSQSQTFTDAEWDYCVKRSKTDQLNCENALRAAWGYETPAKLEIVFNYVANLSAGERAYLQNTVTKGGLALANDPGTIQKLYLAAVGGNNIPRGTALADEIAAIEKTIGTPAYWRDESKQARLRFLYQCRDGD